ncbi:MAG: IS110 family transposase [Candidatus Omnitrophica bacterium]|nr:IS110 family transposase [Candidatus Omnitrophota bacterium]
MNPILVGIDWADQHHDICLMHSDGSIIKDFRITNDSDGFAHLDTQLKPFLKELIFICLETNHGLLFDHLLQFGYRIFPINPGALIDYRKTYSLARNKNDKLDARLLAEYIRKDKHRLREYQMNSDSTQILKLLTDDRQRLLKEKIRLENQLIDTLKLYYPAALKLFCDITNQISLAFLSKHPTPKKAKNLTLKKLVYFLKKHKYTKPQRAQEIFSFIQEDQPSAPDIFVNAKERFVKSIIPQIKLIIQQLNDYDREIKNHYNQHPDKNIFDKVPGVGKDIGPRLLSCFGDCRNRFSHFNDIQCLAGTAPVTSKSGQSCHIFFRSACNKIFRNIVDQMAFSSLRRSIWAKNYYDQQRKKGKNHHAALRALANKWLKIIHRLWITHSTYDENYHLAQITKRSLEKQLAV